MAKNCVFLHFAYDKVMIFDMFSEKKAYPNKM